MKKRLLASFLTIVMLLGMLPTSVFAAGNYKVGDTYSSTDANATLPDNIVENARWKLTDTQKDVLTCEYKDLDEHPHTATCEPKCDHREGHNIDCYKNKDGSYNAHWAVCDPTKELPEGCNHYDKNGEHKWDIGDGCWNALGLGITKGFYYVITVGGLFGKIPAWIDPAIELAGNGFIHLVPDPGAIPNCEHGVDHTDDCYDCKHNHTAECYSDYYTWTLVDICAEDGHNMGNWTVTKTPNTKDTGMARRECERTGCDYYETKTLPTLPVGEDGGYVSDPEKGYTYQVIEAPTCTEYGTGKFTYTEGETITIEFTVRIDKLPHTPGEEATCTEDQTCTVCGEVLN